MKPINRELVDKMVIEALYDNVFSPKAIKVAVKKVFQYAKLQQKEIPTYIKAIKKQLSDVDREISNMVNAIAKGMFHASMKEKMDELETAKSTLIIRINEAEAQERAVNLSEDQIAAFLSQYTNIKKMSVEEQRRAVEMFEAKVTVYDDYVDINVVPWSGPSDDGGSRGKVSVKMPGGTVANWALSQCGPPPPMYPNCSKKKSPICLLFGFSWEIIGTTKKTLFEGPFFFLIRYRPSAKSYLGSQHILRGRAQ